MIAAQSRWMRKERYIVFDGEMDPGRRVARAAALCHNCILVCRKHYIFTVCVCVFVCFVCVHHIIINRLGPNFIIIHLLEKPKCGSRSLPIRSVCGDRHVYFLSEVVYCLQWLFSASLLLGYYCSPYWSCTLRVAVLLRLCIIVMINL